MLRVLFAAMLLLAPTAAVAAEPPILVTGEWLQAHLDRPDVRIVDMTSDPADYTNGHVPGAVYLNVDDARVAVPAGGFRLPTVEEGARLLGSLGLKPATTVVIYDDAGGLHAARLFFTLEALGHPRAAVLDGGSPRWRARGFPWAREAPRVAPTSYVPRARPERVATAEWIRARLARPDVVLVDARTAEEYRGRDVRARRGGHIPGAVNIDWRRNLRPDGTFKPVAELRAMYEAEGVTPDKTVVTYCQTQHRASHSYFVLRLLGYPRVSGYDRSWSEWGNRDDLPIAR